MTDAPPPGQRSFDESNEHTKNTVGVGCWLMIALAVALVVVWFGSLGRHVAGGIFVLVGLTIGMWFGGMMVRSEWDRPEIVRNFWFQAGLVSLGLIVLGCLLLIFA